MNGRDTTVAFAGLLLIVASAILLISELGPDVALPLELGAAPVIGIALFALIVHLGQRTGTV